MSTNIDAPAPRDIGKEATETLQAQTQAAPQQFADYAEFTPQYDAIDQQRLATNLFGAGTPVTSITEMNKRLTDAAALQSQQANSAQRASDLADVEKMSGDVSAQIRGANPELYDSLARLSSFSSGDFGGSAVEKAMQGRFKAGFEAPTVAGSKVSGGQDVRAGFNPAAMQTNMGILGNGQSQIQQALQQQALAGLAQNGQLTPDQLRSVQQSSRSGFASRGLDATNSSVVDETQQTDAAVRARLAAAQQFAGNVDNTGFAQRQALNSQNLALMGANQADNAQRLQANLANQATNLAASGANSANALQSSTTNASNYLQGQNMQNQLGTSLLSQQNADFSQKLGALQADTAARQAAFYDPYQGVLGRSSVNQGSNGALYGQGQSNVAANSAAGRAQFDPFNSYAGNLYSQNSAQANSNAQANAAASNAMTGGLISAAGSAASSM